MMPYTLLYLPEVEEDLRQLGSAEARRVVLAIDERLRRGEPEKVGKSLRQELAGCRRLRVGDVRIVYRVDGARIEVLVIAIGPRRNELVYRRAGKRV